MNLQKTARRITATLLATQSLGSAASSVTGTVNTIIGAQLSGITSLAGLPGAVVQLGSAVAAMLLGATMDRWGRRITLTFGIGLGTLGLRDRGLCHRQPELHTLSRRLIPIWFLTGGWPDGPLCCGGGQPTRQKGTGDLLCHSGRNFRLGSRTPAGRTIRGSRRLGKSERTRRPVFDRLGCFSASGQRSCFFFSDPNRVISVG